MMFESRKVRFVIATLSAFFLSGGMLRLFNDPEGPNLLIVAVFAVPLLIASMAVHAFNLIPSRPGYQKLLLAIALQIVAAAIIYVALSV